MPAKVTAVDTDVDSIVRISEWNLSLGAIFSAMLLIVSAQVAHAALGEQDHISLEINSLLTADQQDHEVRQIPDAQRHAWSVVRDFYAARDYAPVWADAKRRFELGQLAKLAELHGLEPHDYQLKDIAMSAELDLDRHPLPDLAAFDVRVSSSIAQLASDLRYGRLDLASRTPTRRLADPAARDQALTLLDGAADSESLFAYLSGLAPDTDLYRALQFSLRDHRYQQRRGLAWPRIPNGVTLEPGMHDNRVRLVRQRLDVPAPVAQPAGDADPDFYDAMLAEAVGQFQARHLLEPDSLIGQRTLEALNVPIQERVNQLRVNLEWQRWAAMPADQEYLLVNVAHYAIHLVAGDERVWSSKTQVGRYRRQTPAFKSELTSVVANPSWTVPPTIFREDVLPEVKADPQYLTRKNFRVIDKAGQTVDSSTINWATTTAAEFPYRLRARPGASNALGRLKFQMPNPYLVYLHDTPSRNLFDNEIRTFSSGCVRLEKPEQLAQILIARQQKVSSERLNAALASQRTRHMDLDVPMPIVLMYGTVDLDQNGQLVFARDVYRKDRRVLAAMSPHDSDESNPILLASR